MTDDPKPAAPVIALVPKKADPNEPTWLSVDDMLIEFAQYVQANKLKIQNMSLHFSVLQADGRLMPHTWSKGMSNAEAIAFAELAKLRAIEDWRGQ